MVNDLILSLKVYAWYDVTLLLLAQAFNMLILVHFLRLVHSWKGGIMILLLLIISQKR